MNVGFDVYMGRFSFGWSSVYKWFSYTDTQPDPMQSHVPAKMITFLKFYINIIDKKVWDGP